MFVSTTVELQNFLLSCLIGLVCSLIFDLLLGINVKRYAFFDFFSWFCEGIIFWIFWDKLFFGEFRIYTVLGFVLGSILYAFLFHKFVRKTLFFVIRIFSLIFNRIYKILLTSYDFLVKIRVYILGEFVKKEFEENEEKN